MAEDYRFFGCLDFGTDTYAISVPVMRKPGTNYSFIPKTDNHFIVIDVYQFLESNYVIQPVFEELTIKLGDKAPVPIIEKGEVFVVNPDWSESQIRAAHPTLGNEAVKAFVSLKTRLAFQAQEAPHEEVGEAIDDLLKEPVRSRYWVSRFRALARSAFETAHPPDELLEKMERVREQWLSKFATKTSLPLIEQLCDLPQLPLSGKKKKSVILRRFEGRVVRKGIYTPKSEFAEHKELFPEGIVAAILADSADRPEYWERTGRIGKKIDDQLYEAFERTHFFSVDDPRRWSVGELERFLFMFDVLDGDTYLFETAGARFEPLRKTVLADLRDATSNRYEWTGGLSGRVNFSFLRRLEELRGMQSSVHFPEEETWVRMISSVVEIYRKFILLTKIVRPPSRKKADEELGFRELDHALIDALVAADRAKEPRLVLRLLNSKSE